MAKRKEPFIKKNLRPDLKINPDKKLGDLTVRELTEILGYDETPYAQNSELGFWGPVKRIIDSKPFKDYKDNKDSIYEGPLGGPPTRHFEKSEVLEEIIKRITGLENEIKKLKKK